MTTAEKYRQLEKKPVTNIARYIFRTLENNSTKCTLGNELIEIKTGKTPSKPDKRFYEDDYFDWFKPDEIGSEKYLFDAKDKISKYAYDNKQATIYEADTILINAIGDIGRISILKKSASSNQQITGIRFSDKINVEYAYYYLLANRDFFYVDLFQTTLPIVNQKKINSIPFVYPAIEQQNDIVDGLIKLEVINSIRDLHLIEELNWPVEYKKICYVFFNLQFNSIGLSTELTHQLTLVKQLRQSLLREAMQGKLTADFRSAHPELTEGENSAQALLEKIKAEKKQLIKDGKLKKEKELSPVGEDEIPFEIPEGWVWCRLGEIAYNIEYGTSEKADLNSANIPVLRMNNIQNGKIVLDNLKYVKHTIKDLPKLYLFNNDLLFNRTNSWELVGKSGVYKGQNFVMTFASYLIRIQFIEQISVDFINSYINSSFCRESQLEPHIIQQNGQANFNGTKLKNIITPLPPLSEQQAIVSKLDELMRTCDELEASIRTSQQQNEMLLREVLREALEG